MATPGSEQWARQHWGDPNAPSFYRDNIVKMPFCGKLLPVNKRAVPLFKRLEAIFDSHPYGASIDDFEDDYGYANRCIRGTGPGTLLLCRISNHAWGTAIDINATRNAQGTRGDMPMELGLAAERIGFRWGYRFQRMDPMHFEAVLTPAQIKNYSAPTSPPIYDGEEEDTMDRQIRFPNGFNRSGNYWGPQTVFAWTGFSITPLTPKDLAVRITSGKLFDHGPRGPHEWDEIDARDQLLIVGGRIIDP